MILTIYFLNLLTLKGKLGTIFTINMYGINILTVKSLYLLNITYRVQLLEQLRE